VKPALILVLALAVVATAAFAFLEGGGSQPAPSALAHGGGSAKAVLRNATGKKVGTVNFSQKHGRVLVNVRVDARLASVPAGFHGFHVHANDNAANGTGCVADPAQAETTWFVSADGHYKDADPAHANHGAHNGDLPVLLVYDDGKGRAVGEAEFATDSFAVHDILDRALILHKLPDNYRNIPIGAGATQYQPVTDIVADSTTATGLTAATGNAGPRLACGVIRSSH